MVFACTSGVVLADDCTSTNGTMCGGLTGWAVIQRQAPFTAPANSLTSKAEVLLARIASFSAAWSIAS